MDSVNPATEETIDSYAEYTDGEVETALEEADRAFADWSQTEIRERQQLLSNAADVLRENKTEYAELITREMGKPISQAVSEVEKCAWGCEFYAERAIEFLQDEVIGTVPEAKAYVRYEPLGVVLAVMPWNYPFWQAFRFAAPTLAAGNVGVLKHASNVPGCALAIEEVFEEAGFPEHAFSSLLIGSGKVDDVITDSRVQAVTVTGSEFAGKAVAETAGRELKKTVLELGGSDPFVVLEDAPLESAVETAVTARNQNSGQSCIAAKRFVVVDEIYDEFTDRFVEAVRELDVGDPLDESTDIGPQARAGLMEELHDQVERSREAGATVLTGGEPLEGDGHFYPPTILTDVPRDCPAASEETFGPVAAVIRADDAEDAIEIANRTRYGLGGSVWTEDLERGERLAGRIEAGCVFVNEIVKSDPRVPFGGIKDSGYGRELSQQGIREFVNEKTVWVQK
ncbi:NAD-dependent succinate-semialdehyde dehydrogenase [Natrarchaeobius oligotrophus]|uniref:NAD-dependent succinate-semialdehyde dehydrogenase n=1 Tax=Natrarchaeobius chitinivorans TaxID=1679083 RepID=A0A3N6M721_NATCH|nr:NAD-dependent succinate-semialdehyde dehydrogenase [Natrarchaeobius chitinivorans]RQG99413.1 NAD-dependent succinate-semialdehyde dehydrogenase [Natrarchaeobius chitinivorans]